MIAIARPALAAVLVAWLGLAGPAGAEWLAASLSADRHLALIDTETGRVERVEVGVAPWGLDVDAAGRVYVASAEGVAVVDPRARRRLALMPYAEPVRQLGYGEYRAGGMGLAVSRDGRWVYVGVHRPGGTDVLALFDTEQGAEIRRAPVGERPFDVLLSADQAQVYSIDHDSYSVTRIDAASMRGSHVRSERYRVEPLGRGAFDKPHYAVLDRRGRLLLPVQGQVLVQIDPRNGQTRERPMRANTHQHDVAITPDWERLVVVGTGPAGRANAGPNLAVIDLRRGREYHIDLRRPHEGVVLSGDGRRAFLGGGYTLPGGWDGITEVDLESGRQREIPVPGRPQALVRLR